MRIGGIGYINTDGKFYVPNDILTSLSIHDGVILYGIYDPRPVEDEESSKHDFMFTPIPYNFWKACGRFILKVKEQDKALRELSGFFAEENISILYCTTSRSDYRYSTVDIHVVFENLLYQELTLSHEKGYYTETNEQLNIYTKKIKERFAEVLFVDKNNIHLNEGVYNRVNTALHNAYHQSQDRYNQANDDRKIIYKSFTLRYNEGQIVDDFGTIKANTGGKLNQIMALSKGESKAPIPSLVFVNSDTHYLTLRAVVIPTEKIHTFFKLDINYQRLTTPDSSRGLLNFIMEGLPPKYKIWRYFNQLYECRDGYGAGRLTLYLEDTKTSNFINPTLPLEQLKGYFELLSDNLPESLQHINISTKVERIYPDYVKRKFRLNELKAKTPRYDVFLSYSYKDQKYADVLYNHFKKNNIKCFMSKREVKTGEYFNEKIKASLKNSREICILYSPNSKQSYWVGTELAIAWALNKMFVPVFLNMELNDMREEHEQWFRLKQAVMFADKESLDNYLGDIYRRKLEAYLEEY